MPAVTAIKHAIPHIARYVNVFHVTSSFTTCRYFTFELTFDPIQIYSKRRSAAKYCHIAGLIPRWDYSASTIYQ